MRILVYISVVFLILTSCKTQNILEKSRSELRMLEVDMDSSFFYNPEFEYRIKHGDKLSVSIWHHDDLSVGSAYSIYNAYEVSGRWVMVDANVMAALPGIGEYYVEGFTANQLKDSIVGVLSAYIKEPIVNVKVLNKTITVLGEVNAPGKLKIEKDQISVLELVASCGGFSTFANLKYVQVLRQDGNDVRMVSVNLAQSGDYFAKNIQVQPGDVVLVPSRKYKEFDRRISVLIPFTTAITAGSILLGLF